MSYVNGSLYFESISKKSGLGRIIQLQEGIYRTLLLPRKRHYSFPMVFLSNYKTYLMLETTKHSYLEIFILGQNGRDIEGTFKLKGLESIKIIDPIMFIKEGVYYLFGSTFPESISTLNIWSSKSLESEFVLHPCSPSRLEVYKSRMGGQFNAIQC